jgi:hypothetical protein
MKCVFSVTTQEKDVRLDDQVVLKKDTFCCLESMLQNDKDINVSPNLKWRQVSDVLCDPTVPQKLKGKFYRTVIQPAMLYRPECWPTKRRHEQLCVSEIHML